MSTTFLTARDIANTLKISKALAYRLIAQGQILSIRFGRVSRVRQEDLDTFIQSCIQKPDVDQIAGAANSVGLEGKGDIQEGA